MLDQIRARGIAVGALLVALACGGDDGSADAGSNQDAQGGVPTVCSGACAALELSATFGTATRSFERAFFGLSRAGADFELYIESYRGGAEGCPTESSPSPDQTIVVSGAARPSEQSDTGAALSLLDFEGALLPLSPIASATMSQIDWVAADPCVECADGAPEPAIRFVSFDLDATFETGTVTGHLYATHCDSLDEL